MESVVTCVVRFAWLQIAVLCLFGTPVGLSSQAGPQCEWPAPDSAGWRRDTSPQVSVSVPPGIGEANVQWADSRYATWSGAGVWVISDYGIAKAETLPSDIRERERDYRSCEALIGGRVAQIVTYTNPAGINVIEGFWRDVPPLIARTRGYFWIRVEHIEGTFGPIAWRIVRSVELSAVSGVLTRV